MSLPCFKTYVVYDFNEVYLIKDLFSKETFKPKIENKKFIQINLTYFPICTELKSENKFYYDLLPVREYDKIFENNLKKINNNLFKFKSRNYYNQFIKVNYLTPDEGFQIQTLDNKYKKDIINFFVDIPYIILFKNINLDLLKYPILYGNNHLKSLYLEIKSGNEEHKDKFCEMVKNLIKEYNARVV